jgi:hypothetical protein
LGRHRGDDDSSENGVSTRGYHRDAAMKVAHVMVHSAVLWKWKRGVRFLAVGTFRHGGFGGTDATGAVAVLFRVEESSLEDEVVVENAVADLAETAVVPPPQPELPVEPTIRVNMVTVEVIQPPQFPIIPW